MRELFPPHKTIPPQRMHIVPQVVSSLGQLTAFAQFILAQYIEGKYFLFAFLSL
jgi:hypothetical protein